MPKLLVTKWPIGHNIGCPWIQLARGEVVQGFYMVKGLSVVQKLFVAVDPFDFFDN